MDGELKPELSFSYHLRSITTGNRVLYQQGESSPSPTASENRISYYRGEGITERYLATSQGIEQQFLLEKPFKMDWDFIVRGKITTDLLHNTSDSTKGIEFQSRRSTIIIGSPIYMGNIQMKDFLEQHWEILKHKNIYLFTVGMFPWESPESKKSFEMIPEHIRDKIGFSKLPGRLDTGKLCLSEKLIVKLTKARPEDKVHRDNIAPIVKWVKELK